MPEFVFYILMALTEQDEMSVHELSAASGYNLGMEGWVRSHWKTMRRMLALGLIRKPWNGRWMITERGKIALAIAVGRRSRRRALGLRVVSHGSRKAFTDEVVDA